MMNRFRQALPQMDDRILLADVGLETTLFFHDGLDLPKFAVFPLSEDAAGRETLRRFFSGNAQLARRYRMGLVLERDLARKAGSGAVARLLRRGLRLGG